jgi:hypothetical protein
VYCYRMAEPSQEQDDAGSKKPAPDTDRLKALEFLFAKAYDAYQADNERFWRVFNFLTVVNGGLLVLIANIKLPVFSAIVGIAGFVICFLWSGMQRRYGWWCSFWDRKLGEIETEYVSSFDQAGHPLVKVFYDHWESRNSKKSGFSTKRSTGWLAAVFAIVWLAIAALSIWNALKPPGWSSVLSTLN